MARRRSSRLSMQSEAQSDSDEPPRRRTSRRISAQVQAAPSSPSDASDGSDDAMSDEVEGSDAESSAEGSPEAVSAGSSESGESGERGAESGNSSGESGDSGDSGESGDDSDELEEAQPSGAPKRAPAPRQKKVGYYLRDLKDKSKKAETTRRFEYLLGISDLLAEFIDRRAEQDPFIAEVQKQAKAAQKGQRSLIGPSDQQDIYSASPPWLNGKLRQYQIEGLNWLISLHHNCISGILADEMGLGKTLQTISLLLYLKQVKNIPGPHLVLVPKTTLDNWRREINRFAPEFNVLVISGDKYERAELIQDRLLPCDFDICITTFELVIREKTDLNKFQWQYLIVDEAHRIKNEDSMLSKIVRVLFSHNRLLITGTPLQNNLHELWALLNFIIPDVFGDAELFDEWFRPPAEDEEEPEDKKDENEMVEQLHKLLRPFLLRRVKSDVEHSLLPKKEINLYVGLTDMQAKWYRNLLEREIDTVNASNQREAASKKLMNVVMQLRKCCNHPYLFDGAEPGPPYHAGEHLVQNSAKMIVLDKLLKKLHAQGSRVLIFSQMTHMLDILEDYCALREYEYCRIDGSTNHEDRINAIDEYNKPDSSKFLFLLTTRAGGLGINLTTADQVVIYDSDWNPQADLQAMDRAHRIGQTKQVYVYRFVTEDAIEEKVLEKAARKLRLDQLVIQQARGADAQKTKKKDESSKEELVNMIRHGAQNVLDKKQGSFKDESIDDILARGQERTKELNAKYAEYGLDEIQKKFTFKFDQAPAVQVTSPELPAEPVEEPSVKYHMRRARVDYGFEKERRGIKAPRMLPLHDFQFFPSEIEDLQEKEMQYYRKQLGVKITDEDMSDEDEESIAAMNEEIENAEPLSEAEQDRKQQLIAQGFPNFSKRDFHHFLNLMAHHGKTEIDAIVKAWPDKEESELRRYHTTFLARYKEIADYARYMAQIDAGEDKVRLQSRQHVILEQKVAGCATPLSDLQIQYPVTSVKKSYTEDEDRFLLVKLNEFGPSTPGVYEKIRDAVRQSGIFDFDFYFLSRTPTELGRRCNSLLMFLTREIEGPNALKRKWRKDGEEDSDSKRVRDETPS